MTKNKIDLDVGEIFTNMNRSCEQLIQLTIVKFVSILFLAGYSLILWVVVSNVNS